MTDDGNKKNIMDYDGPSESSIIEDDSAIEANPIAVHYNLGRYERHDHIRIFKKLITTKCRLVDPVMIEILELLATSDEIGDERVLLGSLAFVTVLYTNYPLEDFASTLKLCWNLEEPFLSIFGHNFRTNDLEWFKLVMIHGYLQVNVDTTIYSSDMIFLTFDILKRNCLKYTKYSYVAYKILHTWLNKTLKINFWLENETLKIESELESIIFSNWDNCISEVSRRNSTQIFSTYLKIMCEKYENFLNLIFENCIQNLSWQSVTKYSILTEICKISKDLPSIQDSGIPACIFTSLKKNHLKHAGTLLYTTILRKLKVNEWENIFGEDFFVISSNLEVHGKLSTIELLWEQWMKPTIAKFPNIFQYLWKPDLPMIFLDLGKMYLERIGDSLKLTRTNKDDQAYYELMNNLDSKFSCIVNINESVRLMAFSKICQANNWKNPGNEADLFVSVKQFLYFNANASTISLRKGIIKNFKILLANIVKLAETDPDINSRVREFLQWLHEFLLDCFEIGSAYQRKTLGLNLYGIILNFTYDDSVDGVSAKATKYEATLRCAWALRLEMTKENTWNFVDKKSAILLVKLVLDQMMDVREKSTSILVRYFNRDVFTNEEKNEIIKTAVELCNTSKFHEIAGGSALVKILSAWQFTEVNYVNFFLDRATNQLGEMRKDILKSAAQGSPFFGALTAILEIGLTNESANQASDDSIRKILNLVEEATNFFLSALSTKDKDNEYSSSFEDMSLAIEASIRNSEMHGVDEECILSPAHQLVVSCIWMSLKVSCEVAAEIGSLEKSREDVIRTAELIVSVLLKCRHKGAIEAAGVSIGTLTKVLCKGKYDIVMKRHLVKLLSIDTTDNINLTRRGAGLTIMFHRIVSSDDRKTRPFLHFAVNELLNSLKTNTDNNLTIENEETLRDSSRSRHLHFLRSLVADKALHAQLVPYMEDICLTCFRHLKSPDWTVRNGSLQLFGSIVPRLVGQCSGTEFDYGNGNSINHFVTHYPILAQSILTQLEGFVRSSEWKKIVRLTDLPIVNNVVPILVLLSKMSTAGCDLVDYSSKDYIQRAKRTFHTLFGHPVSHVRLLAAKAYAAFVPLSKILHKLALMKLKKINPLFDNYNHGYLLAQYYLERKLEYEMKSTSEEFTIREHKIYEDAFKSGVAVQLQRARYTWQSEFYKCKKQHPGTYTIHNLRCYTISKELLNCLLECPVAKSMMSKSYGLDNTDHIFVKNLFMENSEDPSMPGLSEFVENVMRFNRNCLPNPYDIYLHQTQGITNFDHHASFMAHMQDPYDKWDHYVTDALSIIDDISKTAILMNDIFWVYQFCTMNFSAKPLHKSPRWENLLKLRENLLQIDENSTRPFGRALKYFGHQIAMTTLKIDESFLNSTMHYIYKNIIDEDRSGTKIFAKNCLATFVRKVFDTKSSDFIFDPVPDHTKIFMHVVVELLTDEDPEIRESTSRELRLVTEKIVGKGVGLICARTNFHKILNKLSSTWAANPNISINDCLDNFEVLTHTIRIKRSISGIKSPYDQDDNSLRDDTELLNILFYCVVTLKEQISLSGNDDHVELQQIDGIIRAKYELQRVASIDTQNIENFLKLSTSDYLSSKKRALMKIIHDNRPRSFLNMIRQRL